GREFRPRRSIHAAHQTAYLNCRESVRLSKRQNFLPIPHRAAQRGKCQWQSLLRRPRQPPHCQRQAGRASSKKFFSTKLHSHPPVFCAFTPTVMLLRESLLFAFLFLFSAVLTPRQSPSAVHPSTRGSTPLYPSPHSGSASPATSSRRSHSSAAREIAPHTQSSPCRSASTPPRRPWGSVLHLSGACATCAFYPASRIRPGKALVPRPHRHSPDPSSIPARVHSPPSASRLPPRPSPRCTKTHSLAPGEFPHAGQLPPPCSTPAPRDRKPSWDRRRAETQKSAPCPFQNRSREQWTSPKSRLGGR